jgi:hypothetical protein
MSTITNAAAVAECAAVEFAPGCGGARALAPDELAGLDHGMRVLLARIVELPAICQAKVEHRVDQLECEVRNRVWKNKRNYRMLWVSEAEYSILDDVRHSNDKLRERLINALMPIVGAKRNRGDYKLLVFPGEARQADVYFDTGYPPKKGEVKVEGAR